MFKHEQFKNFINHKKLNRLKKLLAQYYKWIIGFSVLVAYWFCLPNPLFKEPPCLVVEDKNGNILGAKIAEDGQWRFPEIDSLPDKFVTALLLFEDKRFFYHPGIDPISLARAIRQNIREGKIVSGGSTITMQTIRLIRRNKSRTIWEKVIEAIWATRLELTYSKKHILRLYASYAPFGGNTVGLESAAWRFFAKKPSQLSWAEVCVLAVLPNNPGSIFPGKNRKSLLDKRNRLLLKLFKHNKIDKLSYELALEEPLPEAPTAIPRLAPQFVELVAKEKIHSSNGIKSKLRTTIDLQTQSICTDIAARHLSQLKANEINNLAILILNTETNEVVAYVGNAPSTGIKYDEDVDIIQSYRSTGSVLKPLLYAKSLDKGLILPESNLPDIPIQYGSYKPENFKLTYDGVIPVKQALARSLNVPFVKLLQDYGLETFHQDLHKFGITGLNSSANYYGLTMIVGGVEAKLWDLCSAYAGMARTLLHFQPNGAKYLEEDFTNPIYFKNEIKKTKTVSAYPQVLSASAAWFALEAMQELERPDESGEWEKFQSSKKIAWKTGTSFGFRDAWAIGVSRKYTVGVWVGNADGVGRPNLIGIFTAAPILFDIFDKLPDSKWFEAPYDDMIRIPICKQSGYRASPYCNIDSNWVQKNGIKVNACENHKLIHTDLSGTVQLNTDCASISEIKESSWFVLPPIEEYYYKLKNPWYKTLPPFKDGCNQETGRGIEVMNCIYPRDLSRVLIPREIDGTLGKAVFKAAHKEADALINWYIDNDFMATTSQDHAITVQPPIGDHLLTLVDNKGRRLVLRFEVISTKAGKLGQ